MKFTTLLCCISLALIHIVSARKRRRNQRPRDQRRRRRRQGAPHHRGACSTVSRATRTSSSFPPRSSIRSKSRATKSHINIAVTLDILQGDPKELPLTISGEGEIKQVTGEALQDWSIRQEPDGGRTLILRPKKGEKPLTQLIVDHRRRARTEGLEKPARDASRSPRRSRCFSAAS